MTERGLKRLVIVLGDQLDEGSTLIRETNPNHDLIWMAEAPRESQHVWNHKARIVMFLSGMRHFRERLRELGFSVRYLEMERHNGLTLGHALRRDLAKLQPERVVVAQPGEHRLMEELDGACAQQGLQLEIQEDPHFICRRADFDGWAADKKQLRMEDFYRHIRQRTGVLLDNQKPAGGKWNHDASNRKSFGREGPRSVPGPLSFPPDAITRAVIRLVERRFPRHPGSLAAFDWPLTRAQALDALADFIEHRLPAFGPWQDAMWTGEPFLHHSQLSAALNLKLLDPREILQRTEQAYRDGEVDIASAEGFIRQVLGWREFVRGIYWRYMPEYRQRNDLGADRPLPGFYWTGETDMACLHAAIGQTLEYGYAHHIQRLMVTGLFALLLGVDPRQVHEWYLAVYVDAVEWVELPNVLGMSQYADGGIMASKPYVASGNYIRRMSNYCNHCRFNPKQSLGEDACPFTTLYWDFLIRHRERFANHPRAGVQWRHLWRVEAERRNEIQAAADQLKQRLAAHS